MKNILITGGAGFLGAHLVEKLLANPDHNIIVVDNFITSDIYNINEFLRQPNFEFIKFDLTHPLNFDKFPELHKFRLQVFGIEEIYHLACPTSPKDYDHFPLETCLANSHATKNTLDIARHFQSKFLFTSSSAIYGRVAPADQPVKETQWGFLETLGPRACYNDGKRFAENLVVYYGTEYNFTTKICRPFNSYGPKMRIGDGRIVPDFVAAALANEDLIIYGHEDIASTFCYVTDMIDAIVSLMASPESGPMNLGGQYLYKLKDVAQAVIDIINSESHIVFEAPLPYRDPEPIPDITIARERLGWLPITPIEDGLVKTVRSMEAGQIKKFKPK